MQRWTSSPVLSGLFFQCYSVEYLMQCGSQMLYNVFYTCHSDPVIFLGISLTKNCNIFNFDEVLVSSLTPLHPPRFMANGFHDDGTKSHTSSLAFLGCFSRTNPKMFFLTILCIAKDLSLESVEIKVSEKSALCYDLLQSPEEKHSSFHICLQTLLISIYSMTFKHNFDS